MLLTPRPSVVLRALLLASVTSALRLTDRRSALRSAVPAVVAAASGSSLWAPAAAGAPFEASAALPLGVGFGTCCGTPASTLDAALALGYRLIDTASHYAADDTDADDEADDGASGGGGGGWRCGDGASAEAGGGAGRCASFVRHISR